VSSRHRLPNRRANEAYTFEFDGHRYRASAGRFPNGDLAEIFIDTAKAGSPLQLNAECSAVLTSLALQHGVPSETIRHAVNGPIAVALDYFTKIAVLSS
jgi:ribonucleoside-diphosphate reductase alpha chain